MTKILAVLNFLKLSNLIAFVIKLIPSIKKFSVSLVLLAALLGSGYLWHTTQIKHALEVQRVELDAKYQSDYIALLERNQAATDELNQRFLKLEREKNEKIRSITRSYDRTIAGLQDRASRAEQAAASNPNNPSDREGSRMCTGAELSREDSEFLARESARAERLRIELESMYQANDDLVEILNKLRGDDAAK